MSHFPHSSNPAVSVLMPCYNCSRWLAEAIDSVLAQTFRNFELLLLDDGSTDGTWKIMQSYRDRDIRIVAMSKRNTGLADTLNVGIAQAKGEWIARIDQDDLCEITRIEQQINFVRNQPNVVLLGSGFDEIDENGRFIMKHLYPPGHCELVRHLERLRPFFPHSSAFYRVEVVKQVGGYNPRIHRADDWRLWLQLTQRGEVACLPEPLVKIRKHSGQMSLDNGGRRQLADQVAATVCHFLQKAGCKDPSADASMEEWILFLNWVEHGIETSGYFAERKAWTDARATFLASRNRLMGALQFGSQLVQSGHPRALLLEKLLGSSLPQRLAQKWMDSTT